MTVDRKKGYVVRHLDVRGFQIAVDDPALMRVLQGVGDLPGDKKASSTEIGQT
jgi:hypothetical protein